MDLIASTAMEISFFGVDECLVLFGGAGVGTVEVDEFHEP